MNIAVTGASGHIGANLTRRLIADGNKVKVLLHKDKRAIKGLPLEIINGSLNDFR
ncbi:MAG: NmrA family NAD(P)-binding protein, partial [Bacteroidetes bacterium]|nr:NmrA family NAD(P)-binding protein [Bacteroidota bacterium]